MLSAQEPPRFDAAAAIDIVSVPATVTNSAGRFAFGLKADDFEIRDDGVRRTVSQFSAERVPVSLGILLDISGSMATDPKARAVDDARWADTRRALELLVTRLDPRDEVFFAAFADKVGLAVPWTQEHQRIARAFTTLRPGGNTAMFDAVTMIVPAFQLAQHSRKVLLLITDGQDSKVPRLTGKPPLRSSRLTAEQQQQWDIYSKQQAARDLAITATRQAVNTSGAALYAIGMGTRDGYVDISNLEALTKDSGGYVEPVRVPSQLPEAIARVCDELQAQYLLAFEAAHTDGRYHAIVVTTKSRELKVRTRAGYVARTNSR